MANILLKINCPHSSMTFVRLCLILLYYKVEIEYFQKTIQNLYETTLKLLRVFFIVTNMSARGKKVR